MDPANPRRILLFVSAACLVGMAVGSAVTLAVLNVQRAIPTSGSIVAVNVGVFSNSGCAVNLTLIDWGVVYLGDSVLRTVYLKNGGNVPLKLTLATAGWSPSSATSQISIGWDRESSVLDPGQSTPASLTLRVSPRVSGITTFSVSVVIAGSG